MNIELLPIGTHDHPEPHVMRWSELEIAAIRSYAQRCVLHDRNRGGQSLHCLSYDIANESAEMTNPTHEQRIDAALESVLRAAGTSLRHYSMPTIREGMREAMRKVMSDAYIEGSNDCEKAMKR